MACKLLTVHLLGRKLEIELIQFITSRLRERARNLRAFAFSEAKLEMKFDKIFTKALSLGKRARISS